MRQGVRHVRMKGLWIQPRDGRAFYRTRKGGKVKLVALPDLPHDHPNFIAAWAQAAREGSVEEKPKARTLAGTWHALRASDLYASWSPIYRAKIDRQFAAICAEKGEALARAVIEANITKDVAEAPSPTDRLKAWRAWGAWCKEMGLLRNDPARMVRLPRMFKRKGVIGHRRWTEEDLSKFRARWPVGSVPRAMMEFLLWTGVRISDAVRLGPQHVDAGGVLIVRQAKTREVAFVPWSCPLPEYARESDRQAMLEAIAPFAGHMCFLPAQGGRARSVKAATQMMLRACAEADVTATSHGLRKTRAALIIESGGNSNASAAWTGHISKKIAEHYQRQHDRRGLVVGTKQGNQVETGSPKSGNGTP